MSQIFQSAEGIILRVIPFRDYDQILSIFTYEVGLIKVFYKGSRSKRRGVQGICLPLTKVEVIYREKKGEIFSCHELTLMDSFSLIRKELVWLETSCDLLQAILASQLVGKASPQIYALLCFYLNKIPYLSSPEVLVASFRLKLLNHEGLFAWPFVCCQCRKLLQHLAFTQSVESWCVNHQPSASIVWQKEELKMLEILTFSQSYNLISTCEMPFALQQKVLTFFDDCIRK